MRKLAAILTAAVLISGVPAVISANTAAGNYYYTDIVTYLCGAPVNAINVGGETYIDAESMAYYGFGVEWFDDLRRLAVYDHRRPELLEKALDGSLLDMKEGIPGEVAGQYYKTDINVYLDGNEIKSINIGGRTFISAENMRDFEYDVTWDGKARTLTIEKPPFWQDYAYPLAEEYYGKDLEGEPIKSFGLGLTNIGTDLPEFKVTSIYGGADMLSPVHLDQSGFRLYFYQNMPGLGDETGIIYDSFISKHNGAEILREDTSELRERLRTVLRVYINGEEISGHIAQGQGNGHVDLIFSYDRKYRHGEIKTLFIEFGATVYYMPE